LRLAFPQLEALKQIDDASGSRRKIPPGRERGLAGRRRDRVDEIGRFAYAVGYGHR
jgi:hypothetical protein